MNKNTVGEKTMPRSFDEEVTLQKLEGDASFAEQAKHSLRPAELNSADQKEAGSALPVTKLKDLTKMLAEHLSNQCFVKVVKKSLINFLESIDRSLAPVNMDAVTTSQDSTNIGEFKETLSEGLMWWPLGLETFYFVSTVQGDSTLTCANHIENKCRSPDGLITGLEQHKANCQHSKGC